MNGSLFDVDSVKEAMLNPFKVCSYGRYISEEKKTGLVGQCAIVSTDLLGRLSSCWPSRSSGKQVER